MFDIFLSEDVRKLVNGKSIVFLGDSNVRAMYKDFLCLLQNSEFIPQQKLRTKMEKSIFGDKLVYHGQKTNGRVYREEREAFINSTQVAFYFLTKVYDGYVEEVLKKITRRSTPDVIIINSCVWDITRWGCDGVYNYKDNLKLLMKKFRTLLPDCLIIWVTTPPLAAEMKGGFLVKELQFLKYSLRFHVVEANHFARKVVVENGFDILDTHFHLQMQIHLRSPDGIHWEPKAVRYVTNLILRHISLSWDVPLPNRYKSSIIDKNLEAPEVTQNLEIKKTESKKITVDLGSCSETKGKLQSAVTKKPRRVTEAQNKKKRRGSIQLYRVPKREEHIYVHMAKAEKKARKKRIRKWQKPSPDSPQSCAPDHDSQKKKLTKNNQGQRPLLESKLSDNTFPSKERIFNAAPTPSYLLPTPEPDFKSIHSVITNPSQIPLPPYSPGHQQPHINNMQSDETPRPSVNGSDACNFTLSPSQIPLPPYSPGHPAPDPIPLQTSEYPLQPFKRSVHCNFPVVTNPSQISYASYNQFGNFPQRRVVEYQTNSWPSDFTNYGNRFPYASEGLPMLRKQFPQHNSMFKAVNNYVVPYNFPHVIPGQSIQPRYDFVNDVLPEVYYF